VQRLAARIRDLAGWRRALLAFAMGALGAAALPPWHLLPALLPAFTVLLWLLEGTGRARTALLVGWLFGLGHFAVAFHWVGYAFLVDAERFALLLPLAVLGLAGGTALYPALAAGLAMLGRPGWPRLLALAAAWVLAEWLRGRVLTGFPWAPLGLVWSLSDETAQGFALAGVYGLSFLTVLAAAAPARLGPGRALLPALLLPLALPAALWLGGWARLAGAEAATVPGLSLRLVQGNIPQDQKWLADRRAANFHHYLRLSAEPPAAAARLLIWPETATAFYLADTPEALDAVAGLLDEKSLLLSGTPRRSPPGEPFRVWNSLLAVSPAGAVVRVYDKHHLVPFGEFLPFRPLFSRLGLERLAVGAADFSAGAGPEVWRLAGVPALQPLICYEAIFPHEVGTPRPAWLLNVTNDAWFGPGAGPLQHLAQARARAVELGLPLVRAANTGVSAVVDPWGRVLRHLDLGVTGVLDAGLPRALERPTPYARLRDYWLVLPALLLVILGRGAVGRRRN
jgi:apolipoprotein N-acyltransferase